ncbi:MAG: hypothetical protein K2K08_00275 [Paramuribaculum sp.]|nr:hypothetical protein [Paramuribaculum sp.]
MYPVNRVYVPPGHLLDRDAVASPGANYSKPATRTGMRLGREVVGMVGMVGEVGLMG